MNKLLLLVGVTALISTTGCVAYVHSDPYPVYYAPAPVIVVPHYYHHYGWRH